MKFLPRAATFAAVTFCAGALANAATLNLSPLPQQEAKTQTTVQPAPAQVQNVPPSQQVPAPQAAVEQQGSDAEDDATPEYATPEYATLLDAVAAQEDVSALQEDRELRCLATGVYFEARSEPLSGQLAVADVIINRSTSGRFPGSVCSVITQKGQFSFVRGGKLPTPPANAQWRRALAVAQVARKNLWESPAGDALYFHARYVNGSQGRTSVATVGNHIFYR